MYTDDVLEYVVEPDDGVGGVVDVKPGNVDKVVGDVEDDEATMVIIVEKMSNMKNPVKLVTVQQDENADN